eukprot:GGOE01032952.1.p1 GENE.GGOE01032952.1~~GGOE01032952.1.p1  ORF type:complete len:571 (+),score=153.86 GGOE01032952.1:41-1714(+)
MFPGVVAVRTPKGHRTPAMPKQPMVPPPRSETRENPILAEWLSPVQLPAGFMVPPSPAYSFASPTTPIAIPFLSLDPRTASLPQTPVRIPDAQPTTPVKENHTNVYVSGLPRTVTDDIFLELVSQFGQIFSSKVVRKTTTDPPVGFVQYTSAVAAQHAVNILDGRVFGGATLKAKMALRDKDKGVDSKPSANLYICNLPSSFTTADLRRTFEPHGRIVSLVALTDPVTGRSRGTGFVRFSSVKEARQAKEAMHGFLLRPDLPLEVKFAESNAERTQRLKGRVDAASPTTPLSPALVSPPTPTKPTTLTISPSPLLPITTTTATAAAESFHKRARPSPLNLRAPTASPSPEPATEPFLEGIADLKAFLDNVFPPMQHENDPSKLGDDLSLPQQGRERSISHVTSWESFDASEPSLGHLTLPSVQDMLSPIDELWTKTAPWCGDDNSSPGDAISESRIWKFTDRSESPSSGRDVSPPSPAGPTPSTSSTIKIEGLPVNTTEVDLYRLCSPYGAIMQVNLDSGYHGCTAFVQFRCSEIADEAQAKLHGTSHCGAILAVTA